MAKIKIKKVEKVGTDSQIIFEYKTVKGETVQGNIIASQSDSPDHIKWMIKDYVKRAKEEMPPEVQALEGKEFEEAP